MTLSSYTIAGIDVAKNALDLHILPSHHAPSHHTERFHSERLDHLIKCLTAAHVDLVIIEPSGGYEWPLRLALGEAGIACAMVNARHVRHFARASGQLAKSDRLDAHLLAAYGAAMQPRPTPVPSAVCQKLAAWLRRRDQLITMRTAERQRLAQTPQDDIREVITAMIEHLNLQIKAADRKIKAVLATPDLAPTNDVLQSMHGVGQVLSAMIIAHLPELGHLTRRQVASLAGVAPHACDSGAYKGRRRIWGGRAKLRQCLYMGAVAASARPGHWKTKYQQLIAKGKPPKVALVAIMRSMITTLNAMLKQQQKFLPQHSC